MGKRRVHCMHSTAETSRATHAPPPYGCHDCSCAGACPRELHSTMHERLEIRLAMKANDWGLHCSDGHRCAPINISIHRPAASSVPPADPSVRPSPLLPIFLSVYCSVDDLQCRVAGLGSSFIISCKSSSSSPSVQHLFPFFG